MPFQAANLTSEIGLEAFVAPKLSRRWIGVASDKTIATPLSRTEISSAAPSCKLVQIRLSMHRHPGDMWTLLSYE